MPRNSVNERLTLAPTRIISPSMAILPLVYLPDARLREPSKPIERIDDVNLRKYLLFVRW